MVNYHRNFIPRCSEIAQPLSEKTGGRRKSRASSKKELIDWTPDMEEAFLHLKRLMEEDLVLSYPDYRPSAASLELFVDASGTGAGACLRQLQDDSYRVIAYHSTSFSHAQRRYSVIERELAAIRWAVKSFRPFLYGVPFILYTDHRPLTYLKTMSRDNPRINRTLLELEEYDMKVHYCRGSDNFAADLMSRVFSAPLPEERLPDPEYLPPGISASDFAKAPGGGDSLVESLFRVLRRERGLVADLPETVLELRQLLVTKLMENPHDFGLNGKEVEKKKLKLMLEPGVLPCPEIMLVASKIFNIQIHVHYGTDIPLIYSYQFLNYDQPPVRVHLQLLAGIHYNPLIETSKYQPEPLTEPVIPEALEDSDEGEDSDSVLDIAALWPEAKHVGKSCFCESTSSSVINLQVNSKPVCALLDTGASICILKLECWNSFPLHLRQSVLIAEGPFTSLSGVGGGNAEILEIVFLPVTILGNASPRLVPFAIVDTELFTCVILGINFLELFGFTLNYATGVFSGTFGSHTFVGDLTRTPWTQTTVHYCFWIQAVRDLSSYPAMEFEELDIKNLQRSDRAISYVKTCLNRKTPPSQWTLRSAQKFKRYSDLLFLYDGILWIHREGGAVPVVTAFVLVGLALSRHRQLAHPGRFKLLDVLSRLAWHPTLDSIVKDVCYSCLQCQACKVTPPGKEPPVLKIQMDHPWQLISADLLDFPRSPRGFTSTLVVVDHYSKWLAVAPLKDKRGVSVATAFEQRILPTLVKTPERILTDNGPEFISEAFNQVLQRYGITHTYTTPYKPSSNGAVERVNRSLAGLLRSLSQEGEFWDIVLPRAVLAYNNTVHRELQMSPADCIMTRSHKALPPKTWGDERQSWREGHPAFLPFKQGQHVWYRLPKLGARKEEKLRPKYEGPFVIVTVHENGLTYTIEQERDGRLVQKQAHHTQLKRFVPVPLYIQRHPFFFPEPDVQQETESSDTDLYFFFCTTGSDNAAEKTSTESDSSTSSDSSGHSSHGPKARRRSCRLRHESRIVSSRPRALAELPCSGIVHDSAESRYSPGTSPLRNGSCPDLGTSVSNLSVGIGGIVENYTGLFLDLCNAIEQIISEGLDERSSFSRPPYFRTSTPVSEDAPLPPRRHEVDSSTVTDYQHRFSVLLDLVSRSREAFERTHSSYILPWERRTPSSPLASALEQVELPPQPALAEESEPPQDRPVTCPGATAVSQSSESDLSEWEGPLTRARSRRLQARQRAKFPFVYSDP